MLRDGQLENSELMDSSYKLGGGGLCSNAPDLVRFGVGLLDGTLLKAETLALMTTGQRTRQGAWTGYGMGVGVPRPEDDDEQASAVRTSAHAEAIEHLGPEHPRPVTNRP